MKKTLERHKTEKPLSKIPRSIRDFQSQFKDRDIINKYAYTLDGDAKFYIDTVIHQEVGPDQEVKECGFSMFASHYVIDFITKNIPPESRNYLLDGTFDNLPLGFYQMLIVAIEYKNDVSYSFRSPARPPARPPGRPPGRSPVRTNSRFNLKYTENYFNRFCNNYLGVSHRLLFDDS